ncbi:transposase [Halanaeroarchaeum sulfurireducens]|uniref:Transposase IS4 family protein n=1 Tax=Halanaeroarchaeum sulfurireducens TaxID=1604004 RepID=A0A0F7P9L7_9EURY|nr:transposase [Halanaeroarchaeum sulfurireducens]AKH97477.1 transposase IS4 family protein [Halanaeroarchaeum sulfurireducens]ALG81873.1 transposase IS4 family protein [Halanaeroarchaeum sulfurireducens]
MTSNFIRYDQDQQHLLPKDLSEWVAEDSLEQFVSDTIDYLDDQNRLETFYPEETDENRGRPQFHPVMLLKVLVFAYAQGIRSSRKIDRLLERDVAFRFLAANQQPDFRTISNFRKDHRQDFHHLFVEILQMCRQAGMAQMGDVALDGRRVQGDAALEQNRTREQIEEEIQEILDEAAEVDVEEDEEYGPENRGDELPEELQNKESRLKRLREAKAKLDKKEQIQKDEQAEKIRQREEETESGETMRGRKPTPPEEVELDEDTKANTTDPESQTLKTQDGWKQGYNGQAMVDCDSQVIVAQDVTTDANDVKQLEPMLDECEDVNGQLPSAVLGDAGYWSKENAELEDEQTELFIATTKDWKRRKELRENGPPRGPIPDSAGPKELMERKLRTKRGRDIYRKRGQSVEPVFGQHVNRGLDRFMLRGEDGAAAEWSLFSATHNLLKLWRTRWESAG